MSVSPLSRGKVWGVLELLRYLQAAFDRDPRLREVAVRGEAIEVRPSSGGHLSFKLREPSGAVLKCFAYASDAGAFPGFEDGTEVIAVGTVGVYAQRSECQLNVAAVHLIGSGKLAAIFERLKRKLEAEGLFDPQRKRALPPYPFAVALVSSPAAKGATDFSKKLHDTAPHIVLRFVPTSVQGAGAGESIAKAIAAASQLDVDVVVLARGGGADDDRVAFNEESVARAIAACRHPVVTAIGHRADHHVADAVADLVAQTPTEAAEMLAAGFVALPARLRGDLGRARAALTRAIDARRARLVRCEPALSQARSRRLFAQRAQVVVGLHASLKHAAADGLRRRGERLHALERRLARFEPSAQFAQRAARIHSSREALDRLIVRALGERQRRLQTDRRDLDRAVRAAWAKAHARLTLWNAKLDGHNPEAILQQGYAIVRFAGTALRDASQVGSGETIEAQLARGTLRAKVEEVLP